MLAGVVLAVAVPVASGWPVQTAPEAPPAKAAADSLEPRELARRSLSSTVALRCSDRLGAGFFVGEDLILTNAHVSCPGEGVQVTLSDGRELRADLVRADEELDLALLRTAGPGLRPLPLGDAGSLAVGDRVVMVGSPVGLEFTLHEGTVSNLSRSLLGVAYVQIDARINPGNSGGPLLDAKGRVVGVVSMKRRDAEGIGLALPINYAYSGADPLIGPPPGYKASPAFDAMVAHAQEAEQKLANELAAVELRPGLVGAYVDQPRGLVARVVRPSRSPPHYEEFSFRLLRDGQAVCTLDGSVDSWKELPSKPAAADPRVASWLDKNGLNSQLYAGEALLDWDACRREDRRPGIELELEGADPAAARIRLY